MREIKFRGFCNIEKKMYQKFYIEDHMKFAFLDELINSAQERYTLMQYTGLKDKNGVEIFEGDLVILPRWDTRKRKVYFEAGMFKVENGASGFSLATTLGEVPCEVVGNIYEDKL